MRERASGGLRHAPDPARADAYRLSLDGFRRFERGDIDGAEPLLRRSLELDPNSAVTRYRFGRLLERRKDDAAALTQMEAAIAGAHDCPAPIAAAAYLEGARLLERAGHPDRAVAYYRAAATWFGAAADTHGAAARALTRLHAAK